MFGPDTVARMDRFIRPVPDILNEDEPLPQGDTDRE